MPSTSISPVPLPSGIPNLALDDVDAIADVVLIQAVPVTQLTSSPSNDTRACHLKIEPVF
jgi:hypothetical protein